MLALYRGAVVLLLLLLGNSMITSAQAPWPHPAHDSGFSYAAQAPEWSSYCSHTIPLAPYANVLIPALGQYVSFPDNTLATGPLPVSYYNSTSKKVFTYHLDSLATVIGADPGGQLRLYAYSSSETDTPHAFTLVSFSLISNQTLWTQSFPAYSTSSVLFHSFADAIDVIYRPGNATARYAVRFAGKSGNLLWNATLDGDLYISPIAGLPNGDLVVMQPEINSLLGVFALDGKSGAQKWQQSLPLLNAPKGNAITALAFDTLLYVTNGASMFALNSTTSDVMWNETIGEGEPRQLTVVVIWNTDPPLYGIAISSFATDAVTVLDFKTGDVMFWNAGSSLFPMIATGEVVFYNDPKGLTTWDVIEKDDSMLKRIWGAAAIDNDGTVVVTGYGDMHTSAVLNMQSCPSSNHKAGIILLTIGGICVAVAIIGAVYLIYSKWRSRRDYDTLDVQYR